MRHTLCLFFCALVAEAQQRRIPVKVVVDKLVTDWTQYRDKKW